MEFKTPIIYDHIAYHSLQKYRGELPYETLKVDEILDNVRDIALENLSVINNQYFKRALERVIKYETDMELNPVKYKETVDKIREIPQPEQRSQEWFDMRKKMITMSDLASVVGIGKYAKLNDFIMGKLGHRTFFGNSATEWGVKYEPVATEIYENMFNLPIEEFGLLPSPDYDFVGASPDGISPTGIMLEIKCPPKREITGNPPDYYWCQVQGQLQTCHLDRCDFWECLFEEITYQEFKEKDCAYKGCVLTFKDRKLDKKVYFYSPLNEVKIQDWLDDTYSNNKNKDFISKTFWYLKKYSNAPVYRDDEWWHNYAIKEMRKVWDRVLELRANPVMREEFLYKNGKGIRKSEYFSKPQTKKITDYIEEITKNEDFDEIVAVEREMNEPRKLGFSLFSSVQEATTTTEDNCCQEEDDSPSAIGFGFSNTSAKPEPEQEQEPIKLGFCFS